MGVRRAGAKQWKMENEGALKDSLRFENPCGFLLFKPDKQADNDILTVEIKQIREDLYRHFPFSIFHYPLARQTPICRKPLARTDSKPVRALSCHQFRCVIALPQRGHRVLPPAQVVPQLLHWLSREGLTGFTGPQA